MNFLQCVTRNNAHPVTTGLRRACLAAALVGALAAPLAVAQSRFDNVEQCIESATDLVTLPAKAAGTVTARECTACESQRLDIVPGTRFYIGDESVTYAQLKAAADTRTATNLYVFYQTGTRTLTRLRLDADAAGTRK